MKSSRGDAIRELYFGSFDEAIEAIEAAETLGFAYTLDSYTRMISEDEGESQWRLTLYDYWDIPEEENVD